MGRVSTRHSRYFGGEASVATRTTLGNEEEAPSSKVRGSTQLRVDSQIGLAVG